LVRWISQFLIAALFAAIATTGCGQAPTIARQQKQMEAEPRKTILSIPLVGTRGRS
jgi:hypothetical protein